MSRRGEVQHAIPGYPVIKKVIIIKTKVVIQMYIGTSFEILGELWKIMIQKIVILDFEFRSKGYCRLHKEYENQPVTEFQLFSFG